MKRLLFILSLLIIGNISFSQVKVGSEGNIIPTGIYPAVKSADIKGTIHPFQTIAQRDALPANYRDTGMLAYVGDSAKYYSLQGGILNSNWVEFKGGSGGSGTDPLAFHSITQSSDSTSAKFNRPNGSSTVLKFVYDTTGGGVGGTTLQQAFDAAPTANPQINGHKNDLSLDSMNLSILDTMGHLISIGYVRRFNPATPLSNNGITFTYGGFQSSLQAPVYSTGNYNSILPKSNNTVLATKVNGAGADSTGNIIISLPTYTASNGLTMSSNNVVLGGTITSTAVVNVDNTHFLAIENGSTSNLTNLTGSSINVSSTSSGLLQLTNFSSSSSPNVYTIAILSRQSNGDTPVPGVGVSLSFSVPVSSSGTTMSNSIVSEMYSIDSTSYGGQTSNFIIQGIKSGTGGFINNFSIRGDGAAQFYGTVQLKNYTVSTLPSGTAGMTAYVTDAASSPTWGSTATGGGSVVVKVFYNGTNWVYQ